MQVRFFSILVFLVALSACTVERTGDRMPQYHTSANDDPRLTAYSDALGAYLDDPTNEDNIIWLGRRTAYLEYMGDAIGIYSEGLKLYPTSARLLRHRGHRYISTRQFDRAIIDLKRAAALVEDLQIEVEPDGIPNSAGVPRSNLQFNIHYHLGLAQYLQGDMDAALEAYEDCMAVSNNDDLICATTHWMSMTLRRLGQDDRAAELVQSFPSDPEIIENHAYHRLIQLYRDERDADDMLAGLNVANMTQDDITVGYGLVNWLYLENRFHEARALRDAILRSPHVYAFGFIAAESDERFD